MNPQAQHEQAQAYMLSAIAGHRTALSRKVEVTQAAMAASPPPLRGAEPYYPAHDAGELAALEAEKAALLAQEDFERVALDVVAVRDHVTRAISRARDALADIEASEAEADPPDLLAVTPDALAEHTAALANLTARRAANAARREQVCDELSAAFVTAIAALNRLPSDRKAAGLPLPKRWLDRSVLERLHSVPGGGRPTSKMCQQALDQAFTDSGHSAALAVVVGKIRTIHDRVAAFERRERERAERDAEIERGFR